MRPNHPRATHAALYPKANFLLPLFVAFALPQGLGAVAAEPPAVDFARDIRPILARRCFHCHGPDQAEAGLRLHEREPALAELDSTEHAIVPGNADASALIRRVSSTEEYERMPPEGKALSTEEIDLLRRWIAAGAEWQTHWAFVPRQPRTPPPAVDSAWAASPIDAFIADRLATAGLPHAPPASRATLLRRVHYDLIGLPPSPAELADFEADESPNAYEKVVDRLLASPHFGERMARGWLDLVRYAETNSFERDGAKPNAWRYRDYVIRSFNEDKPFDQFTREQLAGDLLPNRSIDAVIATGYYRLGVWDDEPADGLQARYDELDDLVGTTSQVFLGLTVQCARCHDHKIDPIPQRDYYQLAAFFADIRPYGTRADETSWNQVDLSPPEIARAFLDLTADQKRLAAEMLPIEERGLVRMPAEDQRRAEGKGRRRLLDEKLADYLDADDRAAHAKLRARLATVESEIEALPPREAALAVVRDDRPSPCHIMVRGNPHVPGDPVEAGFPELFKASASAPPSQESPGGQFTRLDLANWIVSPDNLLAARVLANRVWQHHFGRGLVRSSNNFGQLGDRPTHPELLDWLAEELVSGGWRLKALHRQIVLSNTYQMASTADEAALAADPANDLFWRFDMRRLSAEEVRDSILAVSGKLNTAMFGPSIYPEISPEVLAGQSRPGHGWGKSTDSERSRRSVYIHVKRSLITPILADFDYPETDTSCAARFATTQPAQALSMLNGDFLHEQARALAARLRREAGDDLDAQVGLAIPLALCRPCTQEDLEHARALVGELRGEHGQPPELALAFYCLVLLNANEFIYLD